MLDKLNAELRGIVEPFVNRWKPFEGKLTGRAQDIENEANAGLDELVKMNPLDPNAISAGFNAVKARLQGLGDKIDSAIEKIEEEWEEATEDLELEEDQYPLLSQVWFGIVRDSRNLQYKIEKWHESIEIKKNADWARLLFKMAQEECSKPHSCPSCGAGIDVTIQHAASAVKCPHCDSVNEINVGPATGYYYQGNGVHGLAQEAVFEKFMAQLDGEKGLQRMASSDRRRSQEVFGSRGCLLDGILRGNSRAEPWFQADCRRGRQGPPGPLCPVR